MSVLSCLLLRVTMTDALTALCVEDKAGKDQPCAVSPNRRLGTSWDGSRAAGPPLLMFPLPLSSSPGPSFLSTSKKLFITGGKSTFCTED